MSTRWTKADHDAFTKAWLSEPQRCGHQWIAGNPRCTACGRKYGKAAGVICPKRNKPNRWRLHCARARQAAQYPHEIPKLDAAWILAELEAIRYEVRAWPLDDRLWKYHKAARRYRKLLKRWWSLPPTAHPVPRAVADPDRWGGWFTRERNKLLRKVKAEGTPIVQVQTCIYRFWPDARYMDGGKGWTPLFGD